MSGKLYYLLFIVLFLILNFVYGQGKNELDYLLLPQNPEQNSQRKNRTETIHDISEFEILFKGLIKTYQIFLSSQQSPQICTFKPSCSQFGYQSIRDYGAFWGLLMTSDRFVRCHNFNYRYYKFDMQSRKLEDPVYIYHIGYWSP